jgi:N-acetylmuramoyl-L-alanine amidase
MSDIIDAPSPNFNERSLPVSMLVVHYTGMRDGAAAIGRLRASDSGVSAHYVVAEDGQVLRLVSEDKRAWHAGKSWWRGIQDINSASVGIEIVNPGHEFGYRPFPEPQIDALVPLVADIVRRHRIKPPYVVGHSDIAPVRKQDPGELFPWARLAKVGLALARPTRNLMDPHWTDGGFLLALERYGYDVRNRSAAVVAFQRRFRPELLDGIIDGECRAILLGLLLDPKSAPAT